MTGNQLTYWANFERERANKASEQLRAKELRQRAAELAWDKAKTKQEIEFRRWQTEYNKFGPMGDTITNLGTSLGGEITNTARAWKEGGLFGALNASSIAGTAIKRADASLNAIQSILPDWLTSWNTGTSLTDPWLRRYMIGKIHDSAESHDSNYNIKK